MLIAPSPDTDIEYRFCDKARQQLKDRTGFANYRKASLLPRALLHPQIADKVYALSFEGYDTAVFQAFKEVEVAVREAAKMSPGEYGVDLMRKAFNHSAGPLTDPKPSAGESRRSPTFLPAHWLL